MVVPSATRKQTAQIQTCRMSATAAGVTLAMARIAKVTAVTSQPFFISDIILVL